MTTDHRTLIDFVDILGLEYECKHCQTRCLLPAFKTAGVIGHCPHCERVWLTDQTKVHTVHDIELLTRFTQIVEQIKEREFGAVIRLHVKIEKAGTS